MATPDAGPWAAYLSADSCVHTLVMSPTLKSTLVPSGCSAEEAAGFGAPAVVVAVVSVNKQHIVVSPSPTLCCYFSYHDKGDQVGHSGRAAPPLAKKKLNARIRIISKGAGHANTCVQPGPPDSRAAQRPLQQMLPAEVFG